MSRPPPEPSRDEFDAIERTAADWFARREFGLTEEETAQWNRWRQADPRHARIWKELEITAAVFDRHAGTLAASAGTPDHGAPAQAKRVPESVRRHPARWLALAAALAVGAFIVTRMAGPDANDYRVAAATEVGGLRVLALPDGSTVRLNTASAVEVRYTPSERRVVLLRGEAMFAVARDVARPFSVDAAGVWVRAVGTEFVVRLRPEALDVLVTEGRVQVEDCAVGNLLRGRIGRKPGSDQVVAEPFLSAGEQVKVPLANLAPSGVAVVTEVGPQEMSRKVAWRDRRLVFEEAPLAEVVAECNRYTRHRLVIDDPALGEQTFGGTFHPESHETLVSLLEQSFDVVAERRGDTTYLRRRVGP